MDHLQYHHGPPGPHTLGMTEVKLCEKKVLTHVTVTESDSTKCSVNVR